MVNGISKKYFKYTSNYIFEKTFERYLIKCRTLGEAQP